MLAANLEAEDVTGQIERANLAAAIVEHLVRTNGTADDFVEVVSWFAFAVDLAVVGEWHQHSHHFDRTAEANRVYWDRLYSASSRLLLFARLREHGHRSE